MNGIASLDFELKDLANPDNIIKPESQNIGNPVMKPVIPSAGADLFSPVFESIYLAILSVPPVLSSVIPIIAPSIIRNPIEAIVLPNPSFIVLTTVAGGSVVNARKSETRKRAINAFSFNFEVRKTMATILIPTRTDVRKVVIIKVEFEVPGPWFWVPGFPSTRHEVTSTP